MFKLVRDTSCVNVVDQEGQIVGHVAHDDLEKCGGKPSIRGFVRKARVLWVNFKNSSQVFHFFSAISVKNLGLLRNHVQCITSGCTNERIHIKR